MEVTRICSECGIRETITDAKDARRALEQARLGVPYVCAECAVAIQTLDDEEDSGPSIEHADAAAQLVEAARRVFHRGAVARAQSVIRNIAAEPVEAPPTQEEPTMTRMVCELCNQTFQGDRASQGLGNHMRTRHPEHYHKKTPTTKKDPAMVEHPASLPRRNTKPLYEVTITVLGKPLTVAQVLELTDQLVALRDSLRRPTSRSPVRSESTQSDSGLGS